MRIASPHAAETLMSAASRGDNKHRSRALEEIEEDPTRGDKECVIERPDPTPHPDPCLDVANPTQAPRGAEGATLRRATAGLRGGASL